MGGSPTKLLGINDAWASTRWRRILVQEGLHLIGVSPHRVPLDLTLRPVANSLLGSVTIIIHITVLYLYSSMSNAECSSDRLITYKNVESSQCCHSLTCPLRKKTNEQDYIGLNLISRALLFYSREPRTKSNLLKDSIRHQTPQCNLIAKKKSQYLGG